MPVKGESPKRVRWTIQRGDEVKKQGELRSTASEQGDHVSEGQVKGAALAQGK